MLMDFKDAAIRKLSIKAEYGLERESLRVDRNGNLAKTSHPFLADKHIDRDFCENQIEIITDVFSDSKSMLHQLKNIQNKIDKTLSSMNELLWCFSNPPAFSDENEICVAVFNNEFRKKNEYRAYLAKKYGKKKMLFSGIHFNFSFSSRLINTAFLSSDSSDLRSFTDKLYLNLSKRLVQYSWLVVFLTAASPVTHNSLGIPSCKYSSVRCGDEGYWNNFVPLLNYNSLDNYIESIEKMISSGKLASVSELYYPVRLKPRGDNSLQSLKQKGVNHIELRVFDVNPLSRVGIFSEDIDFIHILLLYLSNLPDFNFNDEDQLKAISKVKQAAVFGSKQIKEEAEIELHRISEFTKQYFPEYISLIEYQQNKLNPGCSYSEIISADFSENYIQKGLRLAEAYQRRDAICANCSVFLPQKDILQTNI